MGGPFGQGGDMNEEPVRHFYDFLISTDDGTYEGYVRGRKIPILKPILSLHLSGDSNP